ncbi:MAG TPA: transposase [Syntrophales bacterium]
MEPFIKELKRLGLSYVIEIKSSFNIRITSKETKYTPKGKVAKHQFVLTQLRDYFESISTITKCGLPRDLETGQEAKVLYHLKSATVQLNAFSGKHRVISSVDPVKQTTKYLVTDQLNWDSIKIVSVYSQRWVIEEFFRNAKQLADMEGASIRSEQGITVTLCLVSWIDFLLHLENYEQSTAGELSKESLTIPSIVRQWQYENIKAVVERIQCEETFVEQWLQIAKRDLCRKRKKRKELIVIHESGDSQLQEAA